MDIEQIITYALALVGAASIIAAATPNKKDDMIVGYIKKLVDFIAFNVGHAKNAEPKDDA